MSGFVTRFTYYYYDLVNLSNFSNLNIPILKMTHFSFLFVSTKMIHY